MLTRDQLLVLLIEECSEVIKACTKCQRFGFERDNPNTNYGRNDLRLSEEVGDLLGVIDMLLPELDTEAVCDKRRNKSKRAEEMLLKYG